jgi:hypothetical protein
MRVVDHWPSEAFTNLRKNKKKTNISGRKKAKK